MSTLRSFCVIEERHFAQDLATLDQKQVCILLSKQLGFLPSYLYGFVSSFSGTGFSLGFFIQTFHFRKSGCCSVFLLSRISHLTLIVMVPLKASSTRRRHTNLKLGCLNCKRKKIRCDENLPQCENCQRARKESCSYLTLNQTAINKIRLTHSLRNSQNKLLSRDYRLPISSNRFVDPSDSFKPEIPVTVTNSLEFHFEFCHFDEPFPAVPCLTFQFHNMFMEAFDDEYASEDVVRSSSVTSTEDIHGKGLPHCMYGEKSFKRYNYSVILLQLPAMKLMLSLMIFARDFNGSRPFADLLIDSYIVLGRTIMLTRIKQKSRLNPHKYAYHHVSLSETRTCNDCSLLTTSLQKHHILHKESIQANAPIEQLLFQHTVLSYSWWCCSASLLFLNFPRYLVVQAIAERCRIFYRFVDKVCQPELLNHPIFKMMSSYIRQNLLYIHIPLYEPAFLFEMRANLSSLQHLVDNTSLVFPDNKSNELYQKISFYYKNLISFLDEFVLNVANTSRNEQFVTTYPPNVVFNALQRWWIICPTELLSGGSSNECPGFLDDLRNTLFLYFQALSTSLDSLWPAAKYLFTLGFEWVSTSNVANQNFEPRWELYRSDGIFPDCELANFLWRHDIYAMRLSAFFSRRFRLYEENTIYRCPYADDLPNIRYGPRKIKNALELPIRSFNILAIKSHNYAKKIHSHYDLLLKDASVCAIYTRNDDSLEAGNLQEPFDIFDMSQPLQFSNSTRFCQQDYVPEANINGNVESVLDRIILKQYFEDRISILENVR